MQCSKYSTMICIMSIIKTHNGNWSTASQQTYLEKLQDIHGVKIGRRQLNYHLADLEKEELIKRQKRTGRNENGTLYRKTTAICITLKGYIFLAKKGISWAWKKIKELKKKYMPHETTAACSEKEKDPITQPQQTDSLKEKIAEARKAGVPLIKFLTLEKTKSPANL